MSKYIQNLVETSKLSELVELYNGVSAKPRKKFSDKKDAFKSLLKVRNMIEPQATKEAVKSVRKPSVKRTKIADRRASMLTYLKNNSCTISFFMDKYSVSYKSVCTDLHMIRKDHNLVSKALDSNKATRVYVIEA